MNGPIVQRPGPGDTGDRYACPDKPARMPPNFFGTVRSRSRQQPFRQRLVPPLTDRYAYGVYAYPLGMALR